MGILSIKDISKKYSVESKFALSDVSIEVSKGEFIALVGESGCGKTTILRLIAGFEDPDGGEIILDNQLLSSGNKTLKPEKRNVGMVFQDYALFPHLTVKENILFGLSKVSKAERDSRLEEIVALVGMAEYMDRYPHQLSGGQQQRVALARALAPQPALIMLDEPFSNLDAVLKEQVRDDVRYIIKKAGTTAIFVTHDTKDALATADRIAILKDGQIQQIGTPQELYDAPANLYVANFFGKVNVLDGYGKDNKVVCGIGEFEIDNPPPGCEQLKLAIRPENVLIVEGERQLSCRVRVSKIHYYGDHKKLVVCGVDNKNVCLVVHIPVRKDVCLDQIINITIDPDKIHVLS
jgi:iron(III) transport system ATP-binding protein